MEKIKETIQFELVGKKGRLIALAVTVAMLIFTIVNRNLFLSPDLELPKGMTLFVLALLCAPAAGLFLLFKTGVADKYKMFVNTLCFYLLPIVSIQMVECFIGRYTWTLDVKTFIANYICYVMFYMLVYIITNMFGYTVIIVNSFLYVWALVNYFVTLFRTSPFIPMDILTIKTGLNVASGYTYELSWELILGSYLFILIYLFARHMNTVKAEHKWSKVATRVIPLGIMVAVLIPFFTTDFATNQGYKPDFWNQARGYKKTGTFFNFCLNIKYLRVGKPSGYGAKELAGMLDDYLIANGVDPESDTCTNLLTGENDYTPAEGETPNIIYIMNESLADLSILGDLETNKDPMEFIHGLSENTIKGYVTIPVFGAGTSNSEFEALSGDSISFLPAGSNVYQVYLKGETPSMVSTLSTLGYSKTAFHPYYKSGWNRELVYPWLGFDKFVGLEDMIAEDIIETYKQNNDVNEYEDLLKERYPDKKMLLRRFISDSYDYTMIEEMYENRDKSKPFFTFNVTMQNHGGYAVPYRNFYQGYYATSTSKSYVKANRYISLVQASDQAFKELLEYFENVDEPTIICMFGDHYPSIEDEFYEEVMGVDNLEELTTEQQLLRFSTPFVIWANYDIPEATVDHISSNYLSTLLMQTAGLPMTQYNKYLASLYQEMPVISTTGYVDGDGNMYASGETTGHEDVLQQYYCLEYNGLFDSKNRDDSLFYLE